jgi:hypothetical protein
LVLFPLKMNSFPEDSLAPCTNRLSVGWPLGNRSPSDLF